MSPIQVTDGDLCKEMVEVKRADIRLLQPPWADELEDAGTHSSSSLHPALRIHHVPTQVRQTRVVTAVQREVT